MATNATGNGADKQTETPSKVTIGQQRHDPDRIRELFENGEYPYKTRMPRKTYERHKAELQVELLKVQHWVKETGQKIVILFEGRDAAGKGGTIKRFTEHLNPRGARVVALEKPTETERGQWYFQRYIRHLPTEGEIVLFVTCSPSLGHPVGGLSGFFDLLPISGPPGWRTFRVSGHDG